MAPRPQELQQHRGFFVGLGFRVSSEGRGFRVLGFGVLGLGFLHLKPEGLGPA